MGGTTIPPSGTSWLETIKNFDWLKIPGAVRAIAHVIMAGGETAANWIELGKMPAEKIRANVQSDIDARKLIKDEVARKAAVIAAANPEIVGRAMDRWIGVEIRKQENLEAIGRRTIELLAEDPPPNTSGPNEDWLNRFSKFAEDVTAEELRELWSRMLDGEIRKPGSFSPLTLQFVSTLDLRAVTLVQEALPYVVEDNFIFRFSKDEEGLEPPDKLSLAYYKLVELSEIGFGEVGRDIGRFRQTTGSNNLISFRSRQQAVTLWYREPIATTITVFQLSIPGRELAKLLPFEPALHNNTAKKLWSLKPPPQRIVLQSFERLTDKTPSHFVGELTKPSD